MRLKPISYPCLIAVAVVPVSGWAQTAEPSDVSAEKRDLGENANQSTGLGDIIVTAQRRSQSAQSVPIAVTAVSGDDAKLLGVSNPQNLTQVVPGFTFQRNSAGSLPFLRGVGTSGTIIGNEPSVAMFVDDTYITTGRAAIFEFNDIESIEALKGPQGTLFGRNATGGVIHVRTRDPNLDIATVDANVGIANYNTRSAQLYASVPLADSLAVNVSAFGTDQKNGWGRNVVSGEDIFTDESWGVRTKILYEPASTSKILFSYTHAERKSDQGMALRVVPGYFGYANYSPEDLGAGFYDGAVNHNNYYKNTFDQASLKVEHTFENAILRSISAYGKVHSYLDLDLDASPTNQSFSSTTNWGKTFTQEFQLLSPEDSTLNWLVGMFYMYDKSYYGLAQIGISVPGSSTVPGGNGPGNYNFNTSTQVTNSWSGFAQMTAEILPKSNLTIGFRYTLDGRREQDAHSEVADAEGNVAVVNGRRLASPVFGSKTTFKDVTGRISLDHHFSRDVMVYAAYNRGFKSGVYNLVGYTNQTIAPLPAVEPERLDAFSVGFKSELFGRRLRLNAEAFYYDYSNIQVQTAVPAPNAGLILINGGQATIKGADVDVTFAATSRLQVSASISLLDGKYDKFDNGPTFLPLPPNQPIAIPSGCPAGTTYPADSNNGAAQLQCNLAGNDTVFTPPFTSTVSAIYKLPTPVGDFDISANWQHGGNYFSDPDNLKFARQSVTDIINSSIRWTSDSGHLNVRVWASNILGEKYYAYVSTQGASGTKYSPAAPRTYGISAGVNF